MDALRYYRDLLAKHGPTYRAVDAGSVGSHTLRLKALTDIIYGNLASVLDVGCGIGLLCEHLPLTHPYRGIDMLPEMITAAQQKYPTHHFEVGNWETPHPEWRADYVLASGLFQFPTHDERDALRILFGLCRKGMACNFLRQGAAHENIKQPDLLLRFALTLTSCVTLRADYLPNDFTLYLYKDSHDSIGDVA